MKFVSTVCLLTLAVLVRSVPLINEDGTENRVPEEIPQQTSDSSTTESQGYFQYFTDTVKEYSVNKVMDMFKSIPVECKSKINKSGKLIATKKGKSFCEKKCLAIYDKIDSAKETINTIRSYLPFAHTLKLKPRQHQNLPKFKCARNLTSTKLICDCPQAPQFSFGKSLKKYLEKTFLEPSTATRDHHDKHWYPPPYYNNGYGYGPGPYGYDRPYYGSNYGYHGHHGRPWGFNPIGDLFSMIFQPLKILFFIVTLPFWLFLLVFLGLELDDIFD